MCMHVARRPCWAARHAHAQMHRAQPLLCSVGSRRACRCAYSPAQRGRQTERVPCRQPCAGQGADGPAAVQAAMAQKEQQAGKLLAEREAVVREAEQWVSQQQSRLIAAQASHAAFSGPAVQLAGAPEASGPAAPGRPAARKAVDQLLDRPSTAGAALSQPELAGLGLAHAGSRPLSAGAWPSGAARLGGTDLPAAAAAAAASSCAGRGAAADTMQAGAQPWRVSHASSLRMQQSQDSGQTQAQPCTEQLVSSAS